MKNFKDWKNEDLEFCKERRKGAQKIAGESQGKEGPSQLTSWHFKAKLPEYNLALAQISSGTLSTIKAKFKYLADKLIRIEKMSQKEFQELMGQIEVWGEIYIQVRKE